MAAKMQGMMSRMGSMGMMAKMGNRFGGEFAGPLATKPDAKAAKKTTPTRWEFVVFFVWREPTPSDDRLAGGEAPATEAPK